MPPDPLAFACMQYTSTQNLPASYTPVKVYACIAMLLNNESLLM